MGLVIFGISLFIIIVVACLAYSFIFGSAEKYDDEFEEYDAGYNDRHDKSDSQESDNK